MNNISPMLTRRKSQNPPNNQEPDQHPLAKVLQEQNADVGNFEFNRQNTQGSLMRIDSVIAQPDMDLVGQSAFMRRRSTRNSFIANRPQGNKPSPLGPPKEDISGGFNAEFNEGSFGGGEFNGAEADGQVPFSGYADYDPFNNDNYRSGSFNRTLRSSFTK